nr:hypothetical protein BaRGS_009358 [Batillaria attramentaria]
MPYSRTSVGDQDNAELQVAIVEAMLQFEPACSPDLRAFLCGAYMPKCDDDDGTVVLPCASTCNSVHAPARAKRRGPAANR